jgi:acetophenone carboxylase
VETTESDRPVLYLVRNYFKSSYGYGTPTTFVRTVAGSNLKALLEEGKTTLPHTLDEVYEPGNPEEGEEGFHHICVSVRALMNGDTFTFLVGGGAGYGDALERDPEAVLRDLRDGMTTHWAARNVYRIVYDEQTLRLDTDGTERSRKLARAERLRRAKPFDVFAKEWTRLRPPDPVIRHYGSYPLPGRGRPTASEEA